MFRNSTRENKAEIDGIICGNGQRCGGSDNYKDGKEGRQVVMEKLAKYTLTCPVCGAVYRQAEEKIIA